MDVNSIGSVSSIAALATDMSNQRLNEQVATVMQQKSNAQIGGTSLQLLGGAVATMDQAQQIQGGSQDANANNESGNSNYNNPPHLGKHVDVLA